ncbi:uncharacterized protein LOC127698280 [Mytilus californianus]|uniref:uncharacterized protein LOC127698280 n=1 Tax=Mytilus californianus TaxID=6549 RepID=UPI00224813AD|nr:uncharacterized protein LOC127698280 [Mytilus californianus]
MYRGAKIDMSLYACTFKRIVQVTVYIFLVLIAWKCLGNIYTKTNFYEKNQVLDYTNRESNFRQTSSTETFDLSPIELIRQDCGELCDTDRPGTPGPFFDHMTAKINCNALFTNEYIDREHGQKKAPKEIPKVLWNEFTMKNRLEVVSYYFDEHSLGKRKHISVPVWTQSEINGLISKAKKGKLVGNYGVNNTNALRDGLKHAPGVKNGRVLVIGSVKPWAEACVLEAGAREIVTLEYGKIVSHIPNVKTMVPYEFRMAYLNKTLGEFDAVVTFSSVEHSGLGRYGDALNPWGDIIAVARGWCVTKEGGSLTIGVEYNNNQDYIRFNADRCYGKIRYPYLATNWKQFYRGYSGKGIQRVHVFTK